MARDLELEIQSSFPDYKASKIEASNCLRSSPEQNTEPLFYLTHS